MDRSAHPTHADVLDRLTAKQRECLELVLQHQTSKQIAITLGISPHTVNQRLDSARRTLDAATRLDAAVLYAKLRGTPESFVYPDTSSDPYQGLVTQNPFHQTPERAVHDPFVLRHSGVEPLSVRAPVDEPSLHLAEAHPNELLPPWEQGAIFRPFAGPLAGTNETIRRLGLILGLSLLMMAVVIVGLAVGQSLSGMLAQF